MTRPASRSNWSGEEDHYANFIKAVRSRKPADLHADILEGHLDRPLSQGNISYRLGARDAAQIREALRADKDLAEAFGRMAEHLQPARHHLLQRTGPPSLPLEDNSKTEHFGSDAAERRPTRNYRAPFVVPEKFA